MPAPPGAGIFVMGYVKGAGRGQSSLFPVSLDELVPPEHVVRVIDAFVEGLDFAAFGFQRAVPRATGRPPYDPRDLLRLYVYGYLNQVRSSRRLERECHRNVELMWLLDRLAPDHKTISEFRRHNHDAIRSAAARFVELCARAGLIGGEEVAVDGSKFQAVASRKAVVDQAQLDRAQARVEARIDAYLAQLETEDDHDDDSADPPDEESIRRALALLEAERAEIEETRQALENSGRARLTKTEPEARPLKGHGPGYNVQSVVDARHHLIVTYAVIDDAGDNRSLQPMVEAAERVLGHNRFSVLADAGYSNGEQVAALEARGVVARIPANRTVNNQGGGELFGREHFTFEPAEDQYRCPAGKPMQRKQTRKSSNTIVYRAEPADCEACPRKAQCTQGRARFVTRHFFEDALNRMDARATAEAMRRRRSLVEHPFGTLKYGVFEKPRFLLRGMKGAGTEMALATLAYNLKRAMNVLGTGVLGQAIAQAS